MVIRHMSYVACEDCGGPAQMGDDATEARNIALNEGFRRVRRDGQAVDVCPRCLVDPNWQDTAIPPGTPSGGDS